MQELIILSDVFRKYAEQCKDGCLSASVSEYEASNLPPMEIQARALKMFAQNERRMFWDKLVRHIGHYDWDDRQLGVEAMDIVETACDCAGFTSGPQHMQYIDLDLCGIGRKTLIATVARELRKVLPLGHPDLKAIQAYLKALGITVTMVR